MNCLAWFNALQLQVAIKVCQQSNSLSDAGRTLYAVSRSVNTKPNDADRLKKFLARFDLEWHRVC
jgi:transcriptional regulatory protein RtcR